MATTKITLGLFNAIKRLQSDGASIKEVMSYFSLSDSTIRRVFDSETLEEYKNEQQVAHGRQTWPKNAQPATSSEVIHKVEITATHYMMEELKKQTKALEAISNKLAVIIDDLYGVKKEGSA